MKPVAQQSRAWHTGPGLAGGRRFRFGAGCTARRLARGLGHPGDSGCGVDGCEGPKSVLKVLRLRLPESSTLTVGRLESFR